MRSWLNRLLATIRPLRLHDDLDAELQFHIEQRTADLIAQGVAPEDARREAASRFGNRTLLQERTRDRDTLVWLETAMQDVRYALRGFRRNPAFAATAILSLALGIGANTAIFTLIDALLLRALPVRDPKQLVELMVTQGRDSLGDSFSYPAVHALADQKEIFAGLCGFASTMANLGQPDAIEQRFVVWVSGGYYETLGLIPVAGRMITPDDDRPGAVPVAVITEEYWQRRFNTDPRAIGATILIEGIPVTVVGVSPRGFVGAEVGRVSDITLPLAAMTQLYPELTGRLSANSYWLRILARPRPGVSVAQAKARLTVVWPQLASTLVSPRMSDASRKALLNSRLDLIPGATGYSYVRNKFTQPLVVLMALVGLVLLIACANVANLLLARAQARGREIAIRVAIGAGRARLIRQLLTESVVLSALGAIVAVTLAQFASRVLVGLLSNSGNINLSFDLNPNWHTLGFTCGAAFTTSLLFGIAPALQATALKRRPDRVLTLGLVTAQVVVSFVLLAGACLFAGTLRNLQKLDPGFRHDGVLLVYADTRRAMTPALAALYREKFETLARIPGVVAASVSANTPLSGGYWTAPVSIHGQEQPGTVHFNSVSPRFFEALRVPVLAGRDFTLHDTAPVGIVNEAFAKLYFPHVDPLSQHVFTRSFADVQIIGVVRDSISQDLRKAPPPALYVPFFQFPTEFPTFVIRAAGSLSDVSSALRREFQPISPGRPVRIDTLTSHVEAALVQEQLMAVLATSFGALALLLAGVGLYGLLAYTVARRTAEVGIRMALGAGRGNVMWLVLRDALRLLAVGIVLGVPATLAASRLIQSMLFGLTPNDPAAILTAGALLAATGLLAAWVPARRASKVDPMISLRCD
jgi:predicted permease